MKRTKTPINDYKTLRLIKKELKRRIDRQEQSVKDPGLWFELALEATGVKSQKKGKQQGKGEGKSGHWAQEIVRNVVASRTQKAAQKIAPDRRQKRKIIVFSIVAVSAIVLGTVGATKLNRFLDRLEGKKQPNQNQE